MSKLLETWRNGSESFYHALDRTAGTEESVFFYDAMLGDFIKKKIESEKPNLSKQFTDVARTAIKRQLNE